VANEKVAFTRPAAERIAKVVRAVEAGNRDAPGVSFGARLQQLPGPSVLRASWTANWTYSGTTEITFASGTANTATATNVILGVGPGDGWVCRNGSAGWSLVAFDMTKQPGYVSSTIQLFGHSSASAIAQWFSITSCSTATASL